MDERDALLCQARRVLRNGGERGGGTYVKEIHPERVTAPRATVISGPLSSYYIGLGTFRPGKKSMIVVYERPFRAVFILSLYGGTSRRFEIRV